MVCIHSILYNMLMQGTSVFLSLDLIPADNHGGVAQDAVYQSILMSGWEVSRAAGDMSSFLKSPLIPQHNGT